MRRIQSSDARPTVPGARIRALPAAVRPPAPLRGRRPAQALGPCRQGPRLNAVTAPGSGRPPRSWSPAASPPTHRGPSCDRARGSRDGGTRAPPPLTEDARLDRHRRHERALRASATMPSSAHAVGLARSRPNPCAGRLGRARRARRAPRRWRSRQPPCDPRGALRRPRPMRARRAWLRRRGLGGGSSRGYRLSLPGRRCGCGLARNG